MIDKPSYVLDGTARDRLISGPNGRPGSAPCGLKPRIRGAFTCPVDAHKRLEEVSVADSRASEPRRRTMIVWLKVERISDTWPGLLLQLFAEGASTKFSRFAMRQSVLSAGLEPLSKKARGRETGEKYEIFPSRSH